MIAFFANIFGYVLNFIYNIVNNYGVAIIILMNKKFSIKDMKFSEVLEDMQKIFLKAEILKKEDEI